MAYQYQKQVPSSSDPRKQYTVSLTDKNEWQCSCIGWTRTMPRKDCKHIKTVRLSASAPLTGPLPKKIPLGANAVLAPWTPAAELKLSKANAAIAKGAFAEMRRREASEAAIAKRVAVEQKKVSALRKLRFGFQLAYPYDPSKDDLSGKTEVVPVSSGDVLSGRVDLGTAIANREAAREAVTGWVAEIKYDGVLAMLIDGHLINRSGNDITHRFPEIDAGAWADVVLVGEVCVIENGLSVFQRIQERATDDPIAIGALSKQHPAQFMAFDLLELNGMACDRENALVRRAHLEDWFQDFGDDLREDGIELVEQLKVESDGQVQALVEQCRKMETEGVMLKDMSQPYVGARGRNWVKAKSWLEETFKIERYEDTGVGGGWVVYVQSGNHEQRIVCNSAAMKKAIIAAGPNKPALVEVKYLSKSADGALRFPSLRRLV